MIFFMVSVEKYQKFVFYWGRYPKEITLFILLTALTAQTSNLTPTPLSGTQD